jgi:hypothetical protein
VGTEYEDIKNDTEAAKRGEMPFVHNQINLRKPPEEKLSDVIRTTDKGYK